MHQETPANRLREPGHPVISSHRPTNTNVEPARALPLCVDLDGTLIANDLFFEALLQLLKHRPWYVFALPVWASRGRAALKAEVAARTRLNPSVLTYNETFLEWLDEQRRAGRSLWLCTAADEPVAREVSNYLQLFDGVIASNAAINLSGSRKAAELERRFGYRGFDYCGNERIDLEVWKRAGGAVVIGGRRLVRAAAKRAVLLNTFAPDAKWRGSLMRALRPHLWLKNLPALAPLLASHRSDDSDGWTAAFVGLCALCPCVSAAYVLGDLLNLEDDRGRQDKSSLPFASGQLSILNGVVLAFVLLAASLALASLLPMEFLWVLGSFIVLAIAHSWWLKGMRLIGELSLAGLYALRVVAGSAATGMRPSIWMLCLAVVLLVGFSLRKRSQDSRSHRFPRQHEF